MIITIIMVMIVEQLIVGRGCRLLGDHNVPSRPDRPRTRPNHRARDRISQPRIEGFLIALSEGCFEGGHRAPENVLGGEKGYRGLVLAEDAPTPTRLPRVRRLLPLLVCTCGVEDGADGAYATPAADRGRDGRRAAGTATAPDLLLGGRL